ncbi:hypothetical protein JTE90_017028 [Oedothorax gibbosus]|uniref:Uncharacterized protein n=1 Tax=Oedothorax gibbosus TaxID=931172 RepID=A0AAV6UKS5_9ARAC|nr:hypothetical protein JTE90_017028 [Oedothorax gibbosus]
MNQNHHTKAVTTLTQYPVTNQTHLPKLFLHQPWTHLPHDHSVHLSGYRYMRDAHELFFGHVRHAELLHGVDLVRKISPCIL